MGQVLDYPEENTNKMLEEVLHLLTKDKEVPNKIIYRTLFSFTTLNSKRKAQGVSSKRKRQFNSQINPNISSQKRIKFSLPKTNQPNVEGFQFRIEDLIKDINLELKQRKLGDKEE